MNACFFLGKIEEVVTSVGESDEAKTKVLDRINQILREMHGKSEKKPGTCPERPPIQHVVL